MRSFCTLFDKNYLYQGVALYNSLKQVAGEFRLYALCMDQIAYNLLLKTQFENLVPINLDDLINSEISIVRAHTTHGQFCWVCQPLICRFILDKFDVDMVTYLEADSLFYSSPEALFEELWQHSVSVVPHNFSPGFDNVATSGRFCVQFNAFKNNLQAREVLDYWKACCFKYNKNNPLVYPGQTFLDDWPERFDCVKILQHPGAGVAPWNIQHVKFEMVSSVPHFDGVPVVFYHYHEYGRYNNGTHELGHYPLTKQIIDSLYKKYAREIKLAENMVRSADPTFNYRREYTNNQTLKDVLMSFAPQTISGFFDVLKRKLRGTYNIFPDAYFNEDSRGGG